MFPPSGSFLEKQKICQSVSLCFVRMANIRNAKNEKKIEKEKKRKKKEISLSEYVNNAKKHRVLSVRLCPWALKISEL